MTITVNSKRIEFSQYISNIDDFISLLKDKYNRINFDNDNINSSILNIYNELLNEEGNVKLLRIDRWLPGKFGFKHSNRFTLNYWLERGFTELEFNNSIIEKSEITKKTQTKFRKRQHIEKIKYDSNYSNLFKYRTSLFISDNIPMCNHCNSELLVKKSTMKGIFIYKILGCSNDNCKTKNNKSKKFIWESFLPKYKSDEIINNLKKIKRSFNFEFWINNGMSKEAAISKVSEIQSNNSKKVKYHPGKNKILLKRKGYTDEQIRKCCLSMINVEYWIDRGFSMKESKLNVFIHQSNAAKYVDCKKRLLPSNKEYWIKKGFSEDESITKVIKSQTTFSKNICIEKYGEIKGIEIFNERTNKWLNSLLKDGNLTIGYSKMSQILFNSIANKLGNSNFKYATNGGEFKLKRKDGGYYVYDFTDMNNKKIIEYNGDMFHGNPSIYNENDNPHPFRKNITAKMIWDKDNNKIELAKENEFEVLVIWDSEFRYKGSMNKELVIEKCINFLNN